MAEPNVSTLGVNVQVLGHWNPSLFVPVWFADVGLLPEEEAKEADIDVIHEEVAQFDVDWLAVRVTRDRFVASTTRLTHTEALRDLIIGTLELLTHTPTRVMGINHDYVLQFDNRGDFDQLGWTLVSPDNWPMLEKPGVATMQMQGARRDDNPGYVRIKIEPTLDETYRVLVGVNDHYSPSLEAESKTTPQLVEILRERWADSADEAEQVVDHVRGIGR